MGSRRGWAAVTAGLGLVACGIAGTLAWASGMWGLLSGAIIVIVWLCALVWWAVVRPRDTPGRTAVADRADAADDRADADAMVLRVLLDAAPTPLVAIESRAARALNRSARRLFATDDRILPPPAGLADPAVTRLRHEGRGWRVDRVALPDGCGVAALIDIEQEERVAEARATADLIEVLGHELLNGLAPIVSLAESGAAAVARRDVDQDLLRDILGTLARRAEGLQRFAESYRTLARLPEPMPRPVRLGALADDLARLFTGRWPGVALSVDVDGGEWPLDRDQVDQALWALLQNAAEAAIPGPDPQVSLRLHAGTTGLAIDIGDNGAGVPPGDVTRIFRPFHTTKAEGTGVGLSLARQIALAHGGTLTLQPGSPTTFRMCLPSCPEPS
jgi:signal transduction histidine kinase